MEDLSKFAFGTRVQVTKLRLPSRERSERVGAFGYVFGLYMLTEKEAAIQIKFKDEKVLEFYADELAVEVNDPLPLSGRVMTRKEMGLYWDDSINSTNTVGVWDPNAITYQWTEPAQWTKPAEQPIPKPKPDGPRIPFGELGKRKLEE